MKLYTAGSTKANRETCIKLGVGILLVDGWRDPRSYPYFAVDNGCFSAWKRGVPWDPSTFLRILSRARDLGLTPDFSVIPDIVAGGKESIKKSLRWLTVLREEYPSVPLYFAVQDGMAYDDVPEGVDGIFVGGTSEWKIRTMAEWVKVGGERDLPVHVGRIGSPDKMVLAHIKGVDSIDSTTWVQRNGCLEHHVGEYRNIVANQTQLIISPVQSYKPINKMSHIEQEYI